MQDGAGTSKVPGTILHDTVDVTCGVQSASQILGQPERIIDGRMGVAGGDGIADAE